MSGSREKLLKSKIDLCAKCEWRVKKNLVLCIKYDKWVRDGCAKIKRVTQTLAKGLICERCLEAMKEIVKPAEELTFYDQVEPVSS